MGGIVWRLALFAILMPFCLIPILGLAIWPVEFYLLVSAGARIWRRNTQAAEPDVSLGGR